MKTLCGNVPSKTTMHIPRILISAIRGGGGKTLLSLGLARALIHRGHKVAPCKKGPDYIDAAWLAQAAGCPCTNLDPFFLDAPRLQALLAHVWQRDILNSTSKEHTPSALFSLALIEGNRGLFDGRDVQGSCSSAMVSHILATPVILCLDITKMTRTAAAIVAGLANFEPHIHIAGVILNHVASTRHEALVRASIETYTDIPVLGALPRFAENPLPERHMGLINPYTHTEANNILDTLARTIENAVDVPKILAIADTAPPILSSCPLWDTEAVQTTSPRPRIAYVQDAALWFYYAENLEALERAGAEIVPLSLLDPTPWPHDIHGLYLGGGFPESFAMQLNTSPHMERLRTLSAANMPIYAECGGFVVLAQAILYQGSRWDMANVFPVWAEFDMRPQGLGYVEATVVRPNPFHPVGAVIRGHEFHYSRCMGMANAVLHNATLTLNPGTGMGQGCDGFLQHNTFASYMHIYAPACPHWADNFVHAAQAYMCISA